MTRRIFFSIALVSLAVLLTALAVIVGVSYAHFGEELREELRKETAYVAAGVEAEGLTYLGSLSGSDLRITWVAADGAVLYDTEAEPGEMDNHLSREEIREALADGTGSASRYSQTRGENTVYEARRLSDGSVLRLSAAAASLWPLLFSLLQPITLVLLGALLLATLLAVQLSRRIMRPLRELDPDHPEQAELYEELQPLLEKLSSQRRKIARQVEELTLRQAEFDAITANMNEGLIVVGARANVLSCNAGARRILHVDGGIPKSVLQLCQNDAFRSAVRLALSGQPGEAALRLGGRYYAALATPVLRENAPAGAVIVILDETEKEERETLRREFTSNVSHELKTPLTSISGFAELIKNGMTDEADTKRFADTIYREAARLISLVGDIIKLSQLDGGEIPFDREKNDLLAIAREVVERLRPIADGRRIVLTVSGSPQTLQGNRQILTEMLYNLCDNGIKYGREGGFVRITVDETDGHPTVSVEDNGIGIPEDQQDRVFERFYRVDKSHSREIGGTGLGLSIVKHGAQYHKAQIALHSVPGEGTCIRLTF